MGCMRFRVAALALLLVLAAVAVPAGAQSCLPGVATDPTGDVARSGGLSGVPPAPSPAPGLQPDFSGIDLTSVRTSDDGHAITILFTTAGTTSADATYNVSFALVPGPASYANSTAHGQVIQIQGSGTSVVGPAGSTAAQAGNATRVTVPRSAIGAVGGDAVRALAVRMARTDDGGTPAPLTQDDQQGTDDLGPAACPFPLPRGPIVHAASLALAPVPVQPVGTTSLDVQATITNTGTDADLLQVASADVDQVPTSPPSSFRIGLRPGESTTVQVTFHVPGPGNHTAHVSVLAGSVRLATAAAPFTVLAPAVPVGHRANPPALAWLTPLAKGLGLVAAFGDDAEAFLLALLVLACVLALYLALQLGPSLPIPQPSDKPMLRPGTPKRPEPSLQKPRVLDYGDGIELEMTGRIVAQDWDPAPPGASRITPPLDDEEVEFSETEPPERGASEFTQPPTQAPAPAAHEPAPDAQEAPLATPAALPAPVPPPADWRVRLTSARHEPAAPRPGQEVMTTASVQNDGRDTQRVRIVLSLGEAAVAQATMEVAGFSSADVRLAWTAASGRNQVRLQAMPA